MDRIQLFIPLVDISGSVEGVVLGRVNSIMEEVIADLTEKKESGLILAGWFGDSIEWSTELPVSMKEFTYWKHVKSENFSDFGNMLAALDKKILDYMSQIEDAEMIDASFWLFSDGLCTDDYKHALSKLLQNPIFKNGNRYAVNFSDIYDKAVLRNFAGKEEHLFIIKGNDAGAAQKIINAILEH